MRGTKMPITIAGPNHLIFKTGVVTCSAGADTEALITGAAPCVDHGFGMESGQKLTLPADSTTLRIRLARRFDYALLELRSAIGGHRLERQRLSPGRMRWNVDLPPGIYSARLAFNQVGEIGTLAAGFEVSVGGQRINRVALTRAVSDAKGATTHCSRHANDGSRWACVVGDGMDPECFVILVSPDGHWREQNQPPVCRYP